MSQKTQILNMLQRAGDRGVTGNEFYANYLPRFAARIKELRDQGYEISTERVDGNHFVYTLRANNSSSLEGPGEAYGNALQEPERAAGELTTSAAPSLPGSDGSANQPYVAEAGHSRSTPVISGQVGGDGRAHKVESVEPLNVVESPVTSGRSCLNPYEYEAEAA